MKRIKTLLQLAFLSLLLPLSNCLEPITLVNENPENALVIEGTFSNIRERQELRLWRTNGFNGAPNPVSNAEVFVRCTDGRSAKYTPLTGGLYVLDTTRQFFGEVGKAYFIDIQIIGTSIKYQSDPEVIPVPIVPDSVFWDRGKVTSLSTQGILTTRDVVDFFVSTPLKTANTEGFLRWQVQDAFQFTTLPSCTPFGNTETCYYSKRSNPQIVDVLSSRVTGLSRENKIKLGSEPIEPYYRFNELHYFSVYQYSLTDNAYDYWQKYNTIINQQGNIFDKVPSVIRGNVYNNADKTERMLGYFEVSGGAIARTFTRYGEIKEKFPFVSSKESQCPIWISTPDFSWVNACCSCLRLPNASNATKTKPHFWL